MIIGEVYNVSQTWSMLQLYMNSIFCMVPRVAVIDMFDRTCIMVYGAGLYGFTLLWICFMNVKSRRKCIVIFDKQLWPCHKRDIDPNHKNSSIYVPPVLGFEPTIMHKLCIRFLLVTGWLVPETTCMSNKDKISILLKADKYTMVILFQHLDILKVWMSLKIKMLDSWKGRYGRYIREISGNL